jgi:integrase/recombinase XerD
VSAATLPGLIGTLVAARHAGGYRYDFPERVLRQFAGHCRREGYADGSIVREAVEEFLYGRHLKASTIRREELVLRELAEHARQFGWQAWAPPALTAVRKPHRPPPYVFSDEEIRRLFRVTGTQPLSENSNRALVDPVLFRVFYGTGLRLSEALNLELRDFDPARATLEIRDGKNHENRLVPVTGRLAATLKSYIAAAAPAPNPVTRCSAPATPPGRRTSPRFTTGSAVTSPTPASRISPEARTSIRCATASPSRTCAAGQPTARTWWSCCPTCRPTWATPTCAEPSTTSS